MFRAPIYERDWRPSCIVRRSSSSSVVSGARTAIRVTTAVSSLLKLRLLVDEILTNSEDHYLPRSCFGQGPVLGNFFKLLTNFARLAFVLNYIGWYS
jgi:hypothetical protein